MLPSPRLLAAARVLAGATQQELARKAGLAVTSLRRAEFGSIGVRARTLEKLMRALMTYGVAFERGKGREGISIAEPQENGDDAPDGRGESGKTRNVSAAGGTRRNQQDGR